MHPEAELLAAKIELLQHTNMVDFALDIHASLHGPDAPGSGELNERRGVVVARLRELQATAAKVVGFLTNPQLVKLLRPSDKAYNLEMLRTEHQARGLAGPGGARGPARTEPPPPPARRAASARRVDAASCADWRGRHRGAVPLRQVSVRVRQLQRCACLVGGAVRPHAPARSLTRISLPLSIKFAQAPPSFCATTGLCAAARSAAWLRCGGSALRTF